MRRHLVLTFLACILGSATLAAEPPMSRDELIEESDVVVTGTVEQVYEHEVKVRRGTDEHCVVVVRVDGLEKGHGPRTGTLLYAHYKRTKSRPDGWAGPTGQRGRIAKGLRLRLFLQRGEGSYVLLSPNGTERVDAGEPIGETEGPAAELRQTLQDLIDANRSGDAKRFARLIRQLQVPNPHGWFVRIFGRHSGSVVAPRYVKWNNVMARYFKNQLNKLGSSTDFIVFRAQGWRADGLQRRASFAMKTQVPLYTARFSGGLDLWSFAYVGKRWRWLGKLQALPTREPLVIRVQFSANPVNMKQADQHTLRIVIANKSTKTVKIPTVFDGYTVRLTGRGLRHYWTSELKLNTRPRQSLATLAPGQERVVFTVSLRELFQRGSSPRWVWNWEAHPVPPFSPVHTWRGKGYEPSALFFAQAWAGNRTIRSKPVRLQIR